MLRTGDQAEIAGIVQSITYTKQDTGFGVLRVKVDDEFSSLALVHPQRKMAIITGQLATIPVGTRITAKGNVQNHNTYGPQLNVTEYTISAPREENDLIRYIQNEIKLIGPKLAAAMVRKFKGDTIKIMDSEPDRLREVGGIGDRRIEQIKEAWAEKKDRREIIFFCSSVGLSGNFGEKVFQKYGKAAQHIIRQNPYALARDINGIGFTRADDVAKRMGLHELDPRRMSALAEHMLKEAGDGGGHCYMYRPELVAAMKKWFVGEYVDVNMINAAIDGCIANRQVEAEENRLYLPKMLDHENFVADRLIHIFRQPKQDLQGEELNRIFLEVESEFQFPMSQEQRQAVYAALCFKVFALTGNPGVGKTTVTKAIVNGYIKANVTVTLLAPTGMASKRMEQLIGVHAETVHRSLYEIDAAYKASEGDIEEYQIRGVVILDEWSMADIALMAWILRYVHESATIIFVGDKDQLPSVGPGNVLKDLMECKVIPCIHLTQIFRQAAQSNIITNAHRINAGHMPVLAPLNDPSYLASFDMVTYQTFGEESVLNAVVYCVSQLIPSLGFNPLTESIVLAPGHRGAAGVQNFNSILQRVLNPTPADFVQRGNGIIWALGDRVMQFKNNYRLGVFNGDQGIITHFEKTSEGDLSSLIVTYDGVEKEYKNGQWNELNLCYASTIHKVQGCEYPCVVIVIDRSHSILLERNLLYTAVTRGKKRVILIYDEDALSRCVRTASATKRNTFLANKLYQAGMVPV